MTDWQKRYETGDTPWDKGSPAPPLMEILGRSVRGPWGDGTVLVPGCGSGHDVRALAAAGVPALGVDVAPLAIRRAESFPRSADEKYELADFLDPAWRGGKSFSAVWEHTCFCAIDPSRRVDYTEACAELIGKGGSLVGVFFLTPNQPGEENGGPPFNSSVSEIDTCMAPWFERERGWFPEQCYPGREGREWMGVYRRK